MQEYMLTTCSHACKHRGEMPHTHSLMCNYACKYVTMHLQNVSMRTHESLRVHKPICKHALDAVLAYCHLPYPVGRVSSFFLYYQSYIIVYKITRMKLSYN